ncbi:NUDIX hydrolase [Burkholderiaceae bacterium 26]|nr:NUDIX hydrolase [Burkholderiaceae bacterium 26]
MTDPRIQRIRDGLAARQAFDADALVPWIVAGQRVGWLSRERAALLERWPQWFDVSAQRVDLRQTLASEAERTAALAEVIMRLAEDGHVRGWRDERFAVNTGWGTPTLALIERAAARFFGIRTYAAHMNGLIDGGEGAEPALWLARRAQTKPIDPGMWDNLVAGGIGHGFDARGALEKECWEEAGIGADLAARLMPRGTLDVLRQVPEGIQCETLFAFDLTLPDSFVPANQDGEVAGHLRASPDAALDIMADFAMTVDATLVTLDALARLGLPHAPQRFASDNNT